MVSKEFSFIQDDGIRHHSATQWEFDVR